MTKDKPSRHGFFPMCLACKHLDTEAFNNHFSLRCKAFPEKIPSSFREAEYDHRFSHPDDNGVQFEKVETIEELSVHVNVSSFEILDKVIERTFKVLEEERRQGAALPLIED